MPDATGLELIAQQLRDEVDADAIFDTSFYRDRASLIANPKQIKAVIKYLMDQGYGCVASLHGVDYYPEEPRLGVIYEMLDMSKVDRISVKARVHTEAPKLDSIVELFPGANYPEREVFDMFGVMFEGHPDMRRILMPEDYEGHPQRRDFPVGGEPVLFTYNEEQSYGKWQ